jgi:hypothetical protein
MLLKLNVTTHFNRSTGSFASEAFVRKLGAPDQKSMILCMLDRGSNILIGSEICEIERPLNKFIASYLATAPSTPFCLSSAT